jgi:hypothetical protein
MSTGLGKDFYRQRLYKSLASPVRDDMFERL